MQLNSERSNKIYYYYSVPQEIQTMKLHYFFRRNEKEFLGISLNNNILKTPDIYNIMLSYCSKQDIEQQCFLFVKGMRKKREV